MIEKSKEKHALRALHAIFVRARWLALEASNKQLAELLDWAEVLPLMMAESDDQTDKFRSYLVTLSENCGCGIALTEFDNSVDDEDQ